MSREMIVGGEHIVGAHRDYDELMEILTVDELAAFLRVERKTAYAAIARGEIPGARRIGGVIRISRAAVVEWLAQGPARGPGARKTRY
jgi:excisionase family DNA binding protein